MSTIISKKKILIDAVYPDETRVVVYDSSPGSNSIEALHYKTASKEELKGAVYLAKVTRVEPGLQAAFIEYAPGKHGFLPFAEIHPDYFNIPVSDRKIYKNIDNHAEVSDNFSNLDNVKDSSDKDEEQNLVLEDNQDYYENLESGYEIDDLVVHTEHPLIDMDLPEEINKDDIIEDISYANSPISNIYKNYKIHEVVKRGDIILVQAVKEERGNKGASFTSYISLAGRYCVLLTNSYKQSGISRRIADLEDRKRIKDVIEQTDFPEGSSIIVRTAGANKNKLEIQKDYTYLLKVWNSIKELTLNATAPAFIYAESDIIKRTIRDLYDEQISEILIQGEDAYRLAKDFMKKIIPNQIAKIKHYKSKVPLFCKYQIEEQLASLYNPVAYLPSGGYIVINPTEALISIDVNSGRSTSERNIEETAVKTNFEAANEIARQIRLRDLSGLIVIDFIDMMENKNKRAIEKSLKDYLKIDRAKIQIGSISEFGLVEMSRQRLGSSFIEANTMSCMNCNGKGVIKTAESNSITILRTIESEVYKRDFEKVNIYAHPEVVLYILNHKREDIVQIEKKYNTSLFFHNDLQSSNDSFSIERIKKNLSKTASPKEANNNFEISYEDFEIEPKIKPKLDIDPEIIKSEIKSDFKDNLVSSKKSKKSPKKRIMLNKNLKQEEIKPDQDSSITKEDIISEILVDTDSKPKTARKRNNNYRRRKQNKALPAKEEIKPEPESLLKGFWKKILE